MVKGLRLFVLHMGWVEKDKAIDLAMYGMAGASNRMPEATWWRTPVLSVLIDHPQAGWILVDGGARPSCRFGCGGRAPEDEKYNPFYAEDSQGIDRQLAMCGTSADELSMIILSNLDWTRTGILPFARGTKAGQNILVPRDDYAYGVVETCLTNGDVDRLYRLEDFRETGIGYRYIENDLRVAEGVEILLLRGARAATLAVQVDAEGGPFLFTGAAMPTGENFTEPAIPPYCAYDSLAFQETAARLRQLAAKKNVQLIFGGDPKQFETIRKAPDHY